MTMAIKSCAVTGSSGYVGGRVRHYLQRAGWQVADWTRRTKSSDSSVIFRLGEEVNPRHLEGARALVHCAYDFTPRGWKEIHATNVRGSARLFLAARQAGVERIVFISSMSAFPGCRSLYGRAKLEIEAIAESVGACIIRPGLVYGQHPGGVFGGLVAQVKHKQKIPLLSGGGQKQFLLHDEDLGLFVLRYLAEEFGQPGSPVTLAHPDALTLRRLLEQIAAALDRRVAFRSVNWRLAWLGLKTLETLRVPAPFRSDSLTGLIYPNPSPSFAEAKRLNARCRPFHLTAAMVA